MNKVFKVIWNEARNAYVVVSEIAKNHGSKSSSTKKLLAMLIATGVMTCASFDVLAEQPNAAKTAAQQYVALKAVDFTKGEPTFLNINSWRDSFGGNLDAAKKEWDAQQKREKQIGEYTYRYDTTNKYWVREGYVLTVNENGGKYTPLSKKDIRADVASKDGVAEGILQSVTSTVEANGTVTNMGESLNKVTAGSFAGVSHSGGTEVAGSWNYIIQDSSWKNSGAEYQDGYVDLIDKKNKMPKGFITADSNKGLAWDNNKQAYTYKGKAVDYSNVYVIDGKIGVFTNKEGTKVYTGTVYGINNEILMTVKDGDKFYSYWAAKVTDQSTTMATYRVEDYKKDLAVLEENDNKLSRDDIKKVTLDTSKANSATIGLLRNGGKAVDGAITVTSGGGTGGSGADYDTFVKISNDKTEQTFATGSKVEAIGTKEATTGIKINGQDYTIKSGSKVSVVQNDKTTTITVDGTPTTITDTNTHNALASATLDGNKTLTITGQDNDSVSVDLSSIDTDTKYTAGKGIAIDKDNKNAISVKLKEKENNLEVTTDGLALKKDLTVDSVKAGETTVNTDGVTIGNGANSVVLSNSNVSMGGQQIHNVKAGTAETDAVNFGQLTETNNKVENLKVEAGKHTTLVNGTNTTVDEIGDGANGKQYKVNVDLSKYAKADNVAVVYVDNNKEKSLHTTNSGAVGSNAIALGNGASTVKDGGVALGNEAYAGNKGTSLGTNAKSGREGATVVGYNTNSGSLYTTVVGTDSVINSSGVKYLGIVNVQGATATVVGSKNTVDNQNNKVYSGVANGIFGSANTIENSNGVTIQGSGNTVTNAYKDMSGRDFNLGGVYVKKDAGAVGVIGGMNTVSNQIYTNVIGFGNTAAGDADNISQDVFLAGSRNNLNKVSDSIVMGNDNTISDRSNVISFGHNNTISANNAVAIGNGAGVSVEGGVALGVGSVASTDKDKLGYGAAEGETGIAWKATHGAVSVGGNGATRQITNVAAGTEDTDAVNVAQLKTAKTEVQAGANITSVEKTTGANGQDIYTINAKDTTYAAGNGITISGENNAISVKLKEGENNLDVTAGGLALKKDLTGLNSAQFGDTTINADGLTIGRGTSGLEFSKNRVSVGGQQIHDVATGTDDMDAVNVSQLKGVESVANKGWNLSTNGDKEATQVKPGDTVDFSGDDNISVSNDGTKVTMNLNKDLTGLNSAKFGDTTINNDGLTIGTGTTGLEFSTKRVSVGGQKIHDVANGTDDMDAVNVSQLKGVESVANKGWNLSTNGKKATQVKPGDTVDFSGDDNVSVSNEKNKVKVALNKDLTGLNSAQFGDTTINADGLTIGSGTSGLEFSKNRVSVGGQKIHDVADGTDDMDAVNVSQLNKASASSKTTVSEGTNTTVTSTVAGDGHTDYKVNLNKDLTGIESMTNGLSSIRMGNGGTVTINNVVTIDQTGKISGVADGAVKEGSNDAVNGSQLKGVENKVDKNTNDIADNKKAIQKNTEEIVKNAENIQKNTESISKNAENIQKNTEAIAKNAENIQKNTEAIAKNTENISKNTEDIGKLDKRVTDVEEVAKKHTTVSTDDDNVQISKDTNKDGGKNYKVSLNQNQKLDSVTTGDTKMDTNGVTVKDVSLTKDGLSIGDKTYVSKDGLNANNQTITNVENGKVEKGSKDAVNGGQLYETNQAIANNATNISSLSHSISNLDNRVNKVGAGAAALAALHPLDFDPDAKWDFAAGYGNYRGTNAAAVGAYYRPNEDTMFSVGGTFGNGENMVNAGVSFKLGSGSSHVSTSRVAMAKEIKELRGELEAMKSAMLDANAGKKIDTSKLQLFPDVPQNHWAYEYVAQLAGNGMIEGYPDGNFAGDRPMTRYEFAAILYRAMMKGAVLSDKILSEFSHELEYFTVDTVAKDKAGNPTIQRVRTVKENINK